MNPYLFGEEGRHAATERLAQTKHPGLMLLEDGQTHSLTGGGL